MVLMTILAQAATVAQDSIMALTEVTAEEGMNVFELAVKGGWIMIVLALLSIVGIYIFFERLSTLRKAMKRNPLFMDRIHDNIKDDDMKSAANYCRSENTPLSRIIEKGVKSFGFSASSIRESVDNSANLEIANLEKGLPILSTIAAVAPMIGFLGTVTGMVRAFWEMANAGNNIDVSLLSGGIYEAMITTVGGLIVGIIAIFAYNYLVALVDKVQNDLEAEIISFMEIVREKKEL
ncbi:MAG: MotA/TolQ/ExbB proton channel family protein [Bacteroidaceae bacterium]|nr:MotA/TolQ/ExbB proton channel family protein [Bacteroidaceae bacterium]